MWLDQRGTKLRRIDSSGRVLTIRMELPKDVPNLYFTHIAIETDGRLWAVADQAHRVVEFGSDGSVERVFGVGDSGQRDKTPMHRDGPANQALFNEPAGIAVKGDYIVVADKANGAVRRLHRDGLVSTVFRSRCNLRQPCAPAADSTSPTIILNTVAGIAITETGDLWLTDSAGGAVYRFTVDGELKRVAGLPGTLTQLAEADRDRTFAGCIELKSVANGVWCLGHGSNVFKIGKTAELLFYHQQERQAHRERVKRLLASGGELPPDVPPDIGYFPSMAVDRAGRLYFVDASNHVIVRWNPNQRDEGFRIMAGVFGRHGETDGPPGDGTFDAPDGILIDSEDRILVVESKNHAVRLVDGAGNISTLAGVLGHKGNSDGPAITALLNNPTSMALQADGGVLVADWGNQIIRRIYNSQVTTVAHPRPPGAESRADGCGCGYGPITVRVGPDGAIWFLTFSGDQVFRLIDHDRAVVVIGRAGSVGYRGDELPGSLPHARSMAFDSAGNMLIGAGEALLRVKMSRDGLP